MMVGARAIRRLNPKSRATWRLTMPRSDHKPPKGPEGPDDRHAAPDEPESGRLLAASPPHRRLKVFSLDPAVDARLEHALISRSVLSVTWEPVRPGPVGEYLEVVDVDPSSGCVYDPVDLNQPDLLAQDGLSPSTGNPQFHQQMVYAVAMKTIANFERVLGRKLLWAERREDEANRLIVEPEGRYVQRLRIYPHALREQNAYYSPAKTALLFGYFNASTTDPRDELPGGIVFSCLSHDIVAHEMTHAILDGMHRRMLDVTNSDMIAFHEAFADIVAIFQHFTVPGLLLDQIQRSRGSMQANGLWPSWRHSSHGQPARVMRFAMRSGPSMRTIGLSCPIPRCSGGRSNRTRAARSLSPPCSMRSSGCTRAASPTCGGSPAAAPACCRRATFIRIWPDGSPTKRCDCHSAC